MEGFFLNGERIWLRGANLHQDFAGVGVALPAGLAEHKLRLLQEMGCNAVRSAHNPSSRAFLDAADRLGMLVIAENRLLSTAPPYMEDLEALVKRDRNRPSIFAWSLENEELLEDTERGTRLLRRLSQAVRRLDPTRPQMAGGFGDRKFETAYFDSLDIIGTHYGALTATIEDSLDKRPAAPFIADEDSLNPTVRGQYEDDPVRGWASAFGTRMGLFGMMSRGAAQRAGREDGPLDVAGSVAWFTRHPEIGGPFVWTGIDYFGEPTPMNWPVIASSYGAMDLCGFPKDYYWLLRSFFRPEPLVHVMPHWTWPGREGEPIRLWVYSNCERVELELNGASVGSRPVVDHVARWDEGVPYAPGLLRAVGWTGNEAVAEHMSRTAGAPARVALGLTRAGTGPDTVVLAAAAIQDAEGTLCPWAGDDVLFEVRGPGEVIGVGNGDPASLEPNTGSRRRAFRGRCLALIRAQARGPVVVRACAPGLAVSETSLDG
jgi:beta-galactosidase